MCAVPSTLNPQPEPAHAAEPENSCGSGQTSCAAPSRRLGLRTYVVRKLRGPGQPSGFVHTTATLRMRHRSTLSAGTFALCIGWRSGLCGGSCAFRFASYPNISELPVWTLPASPPQGPEAWSSGAANPIVYLGESFTGRHGVQTAGAM